MANEIKQTLGFDASGALNTLKLLDAAFNTFTGQLNAAAAALVSFNNVANTLPKTLNTILKTAPNTGNAITTSLNNANGSVQKLTVSYGLLARVVATQLIVSAFSKLRRTLAEAAVDAIEFQTQIAQVQTIADGSLGTFNQVAESVRGISDAFNLPLGDAAKGLYETISSQIAKGGEAVEFLASASSFAKAGVTSLDNSVTLLSGTLNAFDKDASETDDVASKLFRTIDLGNITAEQLTTSFNRASARSKQLGVSFEEQAAVFATLTNRGIRHNEASTQLSGILTALAKPTDAMTKALKSLGFSSAEAGVKTLGLGPLLRDIQNTTDGTSESLAELFPNIRANSGALQIGKQAAEDYANNLRLINDTSSDLSKQKALEILATDAQRVQSEMNKLSNLLTVDFGQSLLRVGANLSRFTGGVDNLARILDSLGPVLVTAAGLVGAYAIAAGAGATANTAFAASFSTIAKGLLLVAAAAAGGDFIGETLNKTVGNQQRLFDAVTKDAIAVVKRQGEERLVAQRKIDQERLTATLKSNADLNKAYLDDIKNLETSGRVLARSSARIADDIISDREKFTEAIRQTSSDLKRVQEASVGRVANIELRQEDRNFQARTKGLSEARQVQALAQRAQDLASRATTDLSRANGDQAAQDRALALFDRAQQTGEAAQAIADRTGDRRLEFRAAQSLNSITSTQLSAERQLQTQAAARKPILDDLAEKQRAILDDVREQAEIIRLQGRTTDTQGNLLSPEEIKKNQVAVREAQAKIKASGFSAADLLKFDKAGLGKLAREFNVKLAQQNLELSFSVDGEISRVQAQLQASFSQFKLKLGFDVTGLQAQVGRVFQNPDDVGRGLGEADAKIADLRKGFEQIPIDEANIKRLTTSIVGLAAQSDTAGRGLLRAFGTNQTKDGLIGIKQTVADIRNEITSLGTSGNITDDQLAGLQQKLAALSQQALTKGGFAKNIGLATDLGEFSRALGLLKDLQTVQQSQKANPALQQGATDQLKTLERIIGGFGAIVQPITGLTTETRNQSTNVAKMLADYKAISQIKLPAVPPGPATKEAALGGLIRGFATGGFVGKMRYFDKGGFAARGTDTIPAMLSPGEYVVNANSTKKFFSQLQAINAGVQPVFRANGGPVTNVNIGDINLNNTGNTSRQSARSVVNELRREFRRHTSSF